MTFRRCLLYRIYAGIATKWPVSIRTHSVKQSYTNSYNYPASNTIHTGFENKCSYFSGILNIINTLHNFHAMYTLKDGIYRASHYYRGQS